MEKKDGEKMTEIKGLKTEWIESEKKSDKLLIILHGLGDSSAGYHFLPQALQIPELNYLLLNAPFPYFIGTSWFDLPGQGNPEPGILQSRKLLFQLLDDLEKNGWKLSDIAFLGFSQGALMVLDVAVRYPKRLAGIVAISGFSWFLDKLPEEMSAVAKEQKILATHGHLDTMLSIDPTRKQIHQLKNLGMNIEWREYNKDHTIEPEKEIPAIRTFLKNVLAL